MGDSPFDWLMKEISRQFTPEINQDPNGKSDENEEGDREIDGHIEENDKEFSDEEYGDVAEYDQEYNVEYGQEFDFMYQ